jgi:hypothetical protein
MHQYNIILSSLGLPDAGRSGMLVAMISGDSFIFLNLRNKFKKGFKKHSVAC